MTGPTSRTDGSEKSFTVGNRLKQHYIYRLISANVPGHSLPLTGIWDLQEKKNLCDLQEFGKAFIWNKALVVEEEERTQREVEVGDL